MFWITAGIVIICVLVVVYVLCRSAKNREELEVKLSGQNRRSHGV